MRNAEVQRGGWQPRLIEAETKVESAKHRKAAVLTTDYRMNADRGPSKCGMGSLFRPHPGAARCHSLPQEKVVRAGTAHGHYWGLQNARNHGQAKRLRNGGRSSRTRKLR